MGLGKVIRSIAVVLSLIPVTLFAQSPAEPSAPSRRRAAQEVEGVLEETGSLTHKLTYVKVRAKAVGLLWGSDSERARKLFGELWAWIGAQDDKDFMREEARTELLKAIFVKDPTLANRLMESLHDGGEGVSPTDAASGDAGAGRLNDLASTLIEDNPAAAAKLLEQSLALDFTPANMGLLSRLRKRDAGLANGIVSRIMNRQAAVPPDHALPTLYSLTEYVFPAHGDRDAAAQAGEILRRQFFYAADAALAGVPPESDRQQPKAAPGSADMRGFYRAHLAYILSSFAGQYAPDRAAELNELAAKLMAKLPPQQAELARYTAERIKGNTFRPNEATPGTDIAAAIAGENFDEARRLLKKIDREEVRKFFAYQIAANEFKSLMAKSDFTGAQLAARGVEVPQAKAYMLAQIAKATYKKGDIQFTKSLLAEARLALSNSECDEKRALATFHLASATTPISYEDSLDLIADGISCVNSLNSSGARKPDLGGGDSGQAIYAPSLQQAFSSVGKLNLADALLTAGRIESRPLRLLARLSASEMWLGGTDRKVKKPPATRAGAKRGRGE